MGMIYINCMINLYAMIAILIYWKECRKSILQICLQKYNGDSITL